MVDILPVTGAGVTLISPGEAPHEVAASDPAALGFEKLQTELGQGPCLTAYESGKSVVVPDLAVDDRYPAFGPAAVAAGMAAVFTFPLGTASAGSARWTSTGTYRASSRPKTSQRHRPWPTWPLPTW